MPLMFPEKPPELWAALCANFGSLMLDFVARLKVGGTHLTYGYLKQLPVLPPIFYTIPRLNFVKPRVVELTYTSYSLTPFARDLGYDGPPFGWDEQRRAALRADLDAFYARAYGLNKEDLRYILDPAAVMGSDYPSETFRVLKNNEMRDHGEYRTQRLVLEAWDRMEQDGTFAALDLGGETALPDPASLPDRAWAWASNTRMADRLRLTAQYVLWLADEADAGHVRLAIAASAQQSLLMPSLADADRGLWQRLLGPDAVPRDGAIRMPSPVNRPWGGACTTLITSGQMQETADGNWVRGAHFSSDGLTRDSILAQRASFVLQALRGIDAVRQGEIIARAAQEIHLEERSA